MLEWVLINWENPSFWGLVIKHTGRYDRFFICDILHKDGITENMHVYKEELRASPSLDDF